MELFDFLRKDKEIILGIEFPVFKGTKLLGSWSGLKNTPKYKRKDYYYRSNPEQLNNYIALISSYNFIKTSDIKYVKQNAYIIVEEIDYKLHIAFHVNK